MNTEAELETAFEEYRSGTFIKPDRRGKGPRPEGRGAAKIF
ncbi:MAG: hypothetical protein WCW52_04455 [Elusimicrobiales bacterium]|jgi:hypothetical protein